VSGTKEGLDHRMPKTTECNKCGQSIWFNWDAEAGDPGRSDSGRLVPLEVEDNELLDKRHDCPESDYNKGRGTRGGGGRTVSASRTSSSGSGISSSNKDFEPNAAKMILANGLDALGKIERGNQSLESITRTLFRIEENVTKIMKHLNIIDPNNGDDDDGDSQREVSESDFTYNDPDNANNRS
jgi:hypothetical protein